MKEFKSKPVKGIDSLDEYSLYNVIQSEKGKLGAAALYAKYSEEQRAEWASNAGKFGGKVTGKMNVESDTTVTTEEWSLLYSSRPGESWLYHLPSDPKQEKNVINEYPDTARELHQMLVKFMYDHNVSADLIESRLELKL